MSAAHWAGEIEKYTFKYKKVLYFISNDCSLGNKCFSPYFSVQWFYLKIPFFRTWIRDHWCRLFTEWEPSLLSKENKMLKFSSSLLPTVSLSLSPSSRSSSHTKCNLVVTHKMTLLIPDSWKLVWRKSKNHMLEMSARRRVCFECAIWKEENFLQMCSTCINSLSLNFSPLSLFDNIHPFILLSFPFPFASFFTKVLGLWTIFHTYSLLFFPPLSHLPSPSFPYFALLFSFEWHRWRRAFWFRRMNVLFIRIDSTKNKEERREREGKLILSELQFFWVPCLSPSHSIFLVSFHSLPSLKVIQLPSSLWQWII